MNPATIEAIIGILGALIALGREIIHSVREAPFLGPGGPFISKRRASLTGTWTGTLEMSDHPSRIEGAKIVFELSVRRKRVHGKAVVTTIPTAGDAAAVSFDVTARGALLTDSYLKLEYVNSDPQTLQFGTVLCCLDGTGTTLKGMYVGYGHIAQQIVSGRCSMTKLPRGR